MVRDKRDYPGLKYKFIDIIVMTVKMIIYTNRNGSTDLHVKPVKMAMRDLCLIEKYWTETNEKLNSFPGTQCTPNFSILSHNFEKQHLFDKSFTMLLMYFVFNATVTPHIIIENNY